MKTKINTETVRVEYHGLNLEVSGCYTPPEAAVYYYPDGSGYPGSPAEFDIAKIWWIAGDHQFVDVSELFETLLSMDNWSELELLCINEIE